MSDSERVEAAADELYGVLPKDFIATRAGFVAEAKQAGDKEAAKQIGALRRPNTAAWLVNLLVREAPEQIDALLQLGAAMRHAQARLSADELRKLTVQRQQVVRALASQAFGFAADLGEQVSRDALHQVSDTLQAGLADPEIAEQIRLGRLTVPLSYSGFGPAGLQLVRSPEPAVSGNDEIGGDDDARAEAEAEAERQRLREAAKAEVDAAARAVVRAKRAVVTARETLTRADRELARSEQSVAEKQAALDDAVAAATRARSRMEVADTGRVDAEEAQEQAQARLTEAKRAAAELS